MDDTQLRLDGNACAGMLREVFSTDMTAARGACVGCGTVGQLGGQHLYAYPRGPGAVLRCSVCETVLLVLVHARESYRLGLPGLAWMQI